MKSLLVSFWRLFYITFPTLINSLLSGIPFDVTHQIIGQVKVIKKGWMLRLLNHRTNGELIIGNNFKCNNKIRSNSIGLIQPCIFNIATPNSKIIIGNNVGISGSTICATTSVTIGNNVLIGSGCLISDTDSHPIDWEDRLYDRNEKTRRAPITIKDNAFIGARSIILKGVTIGEGAVVGAGSVVSKDVPPYTVVCGNPARVVKTLQ